MIMANFVPRPVWVRMPTMMPAAAQVAAISMAPLAPLARVFRIALGPMRVDARTQLTMIRETMPGMAER